MLVNTAVKKARGEVVELEAARQALSQGDSDTALRRLSRLRNADRNTAIQSLLGTAYAQEKQYPQESCYRRALQLESCNFSARSGLPGVQRSAGSIAVTTP